MEYASAKNNANIESDNEFDTATQQNESEYEIVSENEYDKKPAANITAGNNNNNEQNTDDDSNKNNANSEYDANSEDDDLDNDSSTEDLTPISPYEDIIFQNYFVDDGNCILTGDRY